MKNSNYQRICAKVSIYMLSFHNMIFHEREIKPMDDSCKGLSSLRASIATFALNPAP
mgnify:CR=1 FL=1